MRSLSIAVSVFLSALAAFAQTDRGTITGTISDPAGAVVASAAVEARHVDTGTLYQAGSSATGNYTLAQLPSGAYELSVSVPGFKKFVRPGIVVNSAQTVRIDALLEVGSASESVTVEADAPMLKTESGELSHNIDYTRIDNIPVVTLGASGIVGNIRNPLQVVTLLPGASFSSDNQLRVNGMPSSSYAIRIEGQDATNGMHREYSQVNQAGLDAIQEVAIQTSNFSAEYGQVGGGYFNYTMKSGTNTLHGSAYDYFVNEALNAGTPFTDAGATNSQKAGQHIRNAQRQNDYGFTLGGPIVIPKLYNGHDRSFFFFNFEQFRETQNIASMVQTVPTLAYRRGDFGQALLGNLTVGGQTALDALGRPLPQNGIYDPKTQRNAPDGSVVRDLYPNNTVYPTDLDKVALKIQDYIPLPSGPLANQLINNYAVPAFSNYRHTTIPSIKLDHSISPKIKVSGYYSQTRTFSPRANGFTQVFTSAVPQDSVSHTIRVNYDQTISPTLLLHLGAGLMHTSQPSLTPPFDQSQLGWEKNFYSNLFPAIAASGSTGGLFNPAKGGFSSDMGYTFLYAYIKDIKPTANASLTWVKGNHTYKAGGELIIEGFPEQALARSQGIFTFSAEATSNPWENGRGLNNTTGFPWASFLLGRNSTLQLAAPANEKLGNHSFGFFVQDTWKVTRKLTLDYGLRYDFETLLREQYGRMGSAGFNTPNPQAGGRLGSVIYEATCGCSFNHNYPYALGPRLGAAYQIDSKTVARVGAGVAYGSAPNNAFLSNSVGDFYRFTQPAYGDVASILSDGNPFAVGNKYGNAPVVWPDLTPHYPFDIAPGIRPPTSVFISIDRNAGRPPRIFQWSLGLQREVMRNLVVEAYYVGNRGVWWTAPLLAAQNYNGLTPEGLRANWGLDITKGADRALLLTPLNSPAVVARFPFLANPNNIYPGFPATQPLNQALRPYPQFLGIPPFLGPPLGDTWYDSLQAKVTKRYSHGLDVQGAFTWQKELVLGVNSDTSYQTPGPTIINDVYNYRQNKQISSLSRPLMLVVSFNYTTPGFSASGAGFKALSWVARDWVFGGVLRYQSGELIRSPASNNALMTQLARTDNPATWGGARTLQNRVPDVNPLAVDPNCHCFDPTRTLVLNPKAWTDADPGTFGTAAPYYNDYRWQRRPSESISIGRIFRLAREGKVTLNVRAEFQNIFNRLFLVNPIPLLLAGNPTNSGVNPAQTPTCVTGPGPCIGPNGFATRDLTGGYGFVNTVNGGNQAFTTGNVNPVAGAGAQPRSGQIVARLVF